MNSSKPSTTKDPSGIIITRNINHRSMSISGFLYINPLTTKIIIIISANQINIIYHQRINFIPSISETHSLHSHVRQILNSSLIHVSGLWMTWSDRWCGCYLAKLLSTVRFTVRTIPDLPIERNSKAVHMWIQNCMPPRHDRLVQDRLCGLFSKIQCNTRSP